MKENKVSVAGAISVGITWVEGSIIFKPDEKFSKAWYGICHYSKAIFAFAPIDFRQVTMITTIEVSPKLMYCDRAGSCVYFACEMNRFRREAYFKMFEGLEAFSLGMPDDFGTKAVWFNEPPYLEKWQYFIIPVEGGTLAHKDSVENIINE
jgi:hypothetical protein